ncbi:MAG TPA: transglutaminase domain-containing protein [Rudaea sp.]|nr:transglutaminase domain-containing protein [Rudaea sp.]
MNRRDFLSGLATAWPVLQASVHSGSTWAVQTTIAAGWRTFELITEVDVAEPAGRTQLWLPVPSAQHTDYQRSLAPTWKAPGASHARIVKIPGYDVSLLHVEWPDAKSVGRVAFTARVATRDRRVDPSTPARAPEEDEHTLREYLRATTLLPTDGIVKDTAERATQGHAGVIEKARAIYDWIVDNTTRDPKTPGCGIGDVGSMLSSGYLGGKCADINGLFVAMARAVRIPARDAYGVRVAESQRGFKCLGRSGDVSKAQHCRAEFYAQGHGWIPVDPADVRKVMLEEAPGGLPMSDPKVQSARAMLFGEWEMNWVAYNHGHDVALPGSSKRSVPFLMYPNGETAERRLNSLDAAAFRYSISSREFVA